MRTKILSYRNAEIMHTTLPTVSYFEWFPFPLKPLCGMCSVCCFTPRFSVCPVFPVASLGEGICAGLAHLRVSLGRRDMAGPFIWQNTVYVSAGGMCAWQAVALSDTKISSGLTSSYKLTDTQLQHLEIMLHCRIHFRFKYTDECQIDFEGITYSFTNILISPSLGIIFPGRVLQ